MIHDHPEPDRYCVSTLDGNCVSNDPRCMHNKNATPPVDIKLPEQQIKQAGSDDGAGNCVEPATIEYAKFKAVASALTDNRAKADALLEQVKEALHLYAIYTDVGHRPANTAAEALAAIERLQKGEG